MTPRPFGPASRSTASIVAAMAAKAGKPSAPVSARRIFTALAYVRDSGRLLASTNNDLNVSLDAGDSLATTAPAPQATAARIIAAWRSDLGNPTCCCSAPAMRRRVRPGWWCASLDGGVSWQPAEMPGRANSTIWKLRDQCGGAGPRLRPQRQRTGLSLDRWRRRLAQAAPRVRRNPGAGLYGVRDQRKRPTRRPHRCSIELARTRSTPGYCRFPPIAARIASDGSPAHGIRRRNWLMRTKLPAPKPRAKVIPPDSSPARTNLGKRLRRMCATLWPAGRRCCTGTSWIGSWLPDTVKRALRPRREARPNLHRLELADRCGSG